MPDFANIGAHHIQQKLIEQPWRHWSINQSKRKTTMAALVLHKIQNTSQYYAWHGTIIARDYTNSIAPKPPIPSTHPLSRPLLPCEHRCAPHPAEAGCFVPYQHLKVLCITCCHHCPRLQQNTLPNEAPSYLASIDAHHTQQKLTRQP